MDVIVEGIVRLQQFHRLEIARGLAGIGTYRLRDEYPACTVDPMSTAFTVQPSEIVSTLQNPPTEARKVFY